MQVEFLTVTPCLISKHSVRSGVEGFPVRATGVFPLGQHFEKKKIQVDLRSLSGNGVHE